jgi:hypothetical protein
MMCKSYLCQPCAVQFIAGKHFALVPVLKKKGTMNMFDMPRTFQPLIDILKDRKSLCDVGGEDIETRE